MIQEKDVPYLWMTWDDTDGIVHRGRVLDAFQSIATSKTQYGIIEFYKSGRKDGSRPKQCNESKASIVNFLIDHFSLDIPRWPQFFPTSVVVEYPATNPARVRVKRPKISKPKYPQVDPLEFFEQHKECYRKEAKAIIQGKHWQGKNKCVKLAGD